MNDRFHEFEIRLHRPTTLKLPDFRRNERLFHVILPNQFTPPLLNRLHRTTDRIRTLAASKEGADALRGLLSHRRAMFYFTQVSTRTFLSFAAACQVLGMSVNEIRDPSVSSEVKGESVFDAIRMFSSYSDIVIMRTKVPNLSECCAYLMNDLLSSGQRGVPVINAGSGADQHPTQALLDVYTLQSAFEFASPRDSSRWTLFESLRKKYPYLRKGLENKVVVFAGDIGRGRTVRSLAYLLAQYQGVQMRFVAPPHPKLQLSRDLKDFLLKRGVHLSEHEHIDEVIDEADALYLTRIQTEHNTQDDALVLHPSNLERVRVTSALAERMKDYAVILHPFPRNEELPSELDTNPRARYFDQAVNGMWSRAALLAHVFDVEAHIGEIFDSMTHEFHNYNESVL